MVFAALLLYQLSAMLESPPMKIARKDRSLIALTLFVSVMFSLFVCGVHHGQMSGLGLSGLDGGFCAEGSGHGAGVQLDGDETGHAMASYTCPLCSSFGMALALNSSSWGLSLLPVAAAVPTEQPSWAQPPPRYLWPSLNPRASPLHIPA